MADFTFATLRLKTSVEEIKHKLKNRWRFN